MTGNRYRNQLADHLTGIIVDNIQDPKATTVAQLVTHKIQRPALIDACRDDHRQSRALQLLASLGADLQIFLRIEAVRAFLVDHQAL